MRITCCPYYLARSRAGFLVPGGRVQFLDKVNGNGAHPETAAAPQMATAGAAVNGAPEALGDDIPF